MNNVTNKQVIVAKEIQVVALGNVTTLTLGVPGIKAEFQRSSRV